MFALPIMDTALAFARRLVARRSVFSADRHHFHHQMVARGLSVKQTVLLAYGMTILFVVGGGAVAYLRTRYVIAAYLITFGFMVVTAVKMGMVHERHRAIARKTLEQATEPGSAPDAPNSSAVFEPATAIDVRDESQPSRADRIPVELADLAGIWQEPQPIPAPGEPLRARKAE
jgi:hypothetical protein